MVQGRLGYYLPATRIPDHLLAIIAPLVNDLIEWMKRERAKLSWHNEVAKAMDYMLKRVDVFTRFLDDGRILGPIALQSPREKDRLIARRVTCLPRKQLFINGAATLADIAAA